MIPILGDVIREVGGIVREILPDADKRAELDYKLSELADRADARENELVTGQLAINEAEAKNANIFVSGWRPAIGWVCSVTLAHTWIIAPIAHAIWPHNPMPALNPDATYPIILGMLGLGGLRTIERSRGVANGQTPAESPKPSKPNIISRVIPDWLR